FALGVMLFQMTTGTLPFRGDNPIDLLQSTLRDDPADLAEHAPGTPPRFAALVAKLLKKHPMDRPASAADVARELDAIARELGDMPTSVTGAAGPQPPSALATRRISRRSTQLAAVAALVALAAAAYPIYDRQRSRAEARRLYEQGRQTLELGDPQAFRLAAEQFGRAASIDPKFVLAWVERSSALVRAYEDDRVAELLSEADASARKAVELAPNSISARLAEARVQRSRGRASKAIESLTPLISTAGNDLVDVHAELAFSYEQAGDPRKAEEHFLAAVAARPGFWQPWNELGRFRTRMGNYPGARSAFERARELAPAAKTAPSENLATLLVYEGRYDEALALYESISGGVADAEAASNLATLYFFNGRFADADRSYRRAIQISPRQPIYHRNLADTLLKLQRVEEATQEYALALDLVNRLLHSNATDIDLRLQRALYLARAGRCPEAVAYASELGRTLSESAAIEHALSRPFALCGRNLEAIDHLQRAVALGFMPASLRQEDELAGLRDEPAFKRLVDGTDGVTAGRD
ncbi:MAG: tetratricopeptide repeat protein, partial [Candidatus Binatia bacterium]